MCKTATTLLESFRGDAMVARLGSDGVAVIIPDLEEEMVVKIIDRLRENIIRYNRTLHKNDLPHGVYLHWFSYNTEWD